MCVVVHVRIGNAGDLPLTFRKKYTQEGRRRALPVDAYKHVGANAGRFALNLSVHTPLSDVFAANVMSLRALETWDTQQAPE